MMEGMMNENKQDPRIELHRKICTDMTDLYKRKNNDYGDSFAILRKEHPKSIQYRIFDKYTRLKTLMNGAEQMVKDESIDDTLMDLANYCILELLERKVERDERKTEERR